MYFFFNNLENKRFTAVTFWQIYAHFNTLKKSITVHSYGQREREECEEDGERTCLLSISFQNHGHRPP